MQAWSKRGPEGGLVRFERCLQHRVSPARKQSGDDFGFGRGLDRITVECRPQRAPYPIRCCRVAKEAFCRRAGSALRIQHERLDHRGALVGGQGPSNRCARRMHRRNACEREPPARNWQVQHGSAVARPDSMHTRGRQTRTAQFVPGLSGRMLLREAGLQPFVQDLVRRGRVGLGDVSHALPHSTRLRLACDTNSHIGVVISTPGKVMN